VRRLAEPTVPKATTQNPEGVQEGSLIVAGTFTNIKLHIIFSTKCREPFITEDLRIGESITGGKGKTIYRKSEGTSPSEELSRGVYRIFEGK